MVADGIAAVTGVDCLNVLVNNPQQVPIAFTDAGELLRESPPGGGDLIPLTPPIPLPLGAYMADALADNRMYIAISDLVKGLIPPLVVDGPSGALSVAGQNPIGALWQSGVWYQVGDLVRSTDGRWWRCTDAATAISTSTAPSWPQFNGYFLPALNFQPAVVAENISGTQWQEWTPAVQQYLPAPDVSGMVVTQIAGIGLIPAGKDVYIKVTYVATTASGVGESPRSLVMVLVNSSANARIFIQQVGSVDGSNNMPQWLANLFLNEDNVFNGQITANIYVAAVNHGAAAPADSSYFFYQNIAMPSSFVISSIPNSTQATAQGAPVVISPYISTDPGGALGSFIGEGGTRYFIVLRQNLNGSFSPVDTGSPIPISLVGQVEVDIVNIERDGSGNVTATVGDITGFAVGQGVQVQGCTKDATFNSGISPFILNKVYQTLAPGGVLKWLDTNHLSQSNDDTGAVILPAGPPPVAFLPPGGPNDMQDCVAFTVAAPQTGQPVNLPAGPFNIIPASNPKLPFAATILSMQGPQTLQFSGVALTRDAGGDVQATLADIAGIQPGATVTVLNAGDASFDGDFTLLGVTPTTGTGGTLTWQQADTAATSTTATLTIGIQVLGEVQAVVDNASGFAAGDVVTIRNASPAAFNGTVTIASVLGNVVTFPSAATGTASQAGLLTMQMFLLQVLPTVAAANEANIISIQRDARGNVSAVIPSIYGWSEGQVAVVANVGDPSFDGNFEVVSAVVNNDLITATISWVQYGTPALPPAASSSGGTLGSIPIFTCNFDDNALSAEDVTSQLTAMAPPNSTDVFFSETLNRMVYTKGNDTAHYFSNIGDNENIDQAGGILPVAENNGAVTVCFREMESGELLSLKANGGYAIEQNDNTPSGWEVVRRWKNHGPVNAKAVALGPDFLIVFVEYSGPYRYDGHQFEWIGREKQGTWDRVNWAAKNTIWCEVDDDKKTVHFGLPLDGSPTPNKDVKCNYFNGWQDPLIVNMMGQVIPNRYGRRWSEDDLAATCGKLVLRTLNPSVDNRINDRQMLFGLSRAVLPGETGYGEGPYGADGYGGLGTGVITPTQAFVDMEVPDTYSDDGPVGDVSTTSENPVFGNGNSQTLQVADLTNISVGTKLLIDPGVNEEKFTVTSITNGLLAAVFTKSHDPGSVVLSADYSQIGIDWQYQPAFAQSPTFEIFRWSKIKGRYLGSGLINFEPVTEDPNFEVDPLVSNSQVGIPTKFAFGVNVEGDNEMLSFNINNGAEPGVWGELHGLVIGGNEVAASQETQ